MLNNIPSALLTEWMAFYSIHPFGEERADIRAGIIASTIAEINRDKKQRLRPFTFADFMPKFETRFVRKKLPSQDELTEKILAAFGVKRK